MVLDRHRLEVAAGSGSLGLLADDVLVALLHLLHRRPLTEGDREALSHAGDVLTAAMTLQGEEIATGPVLRTMAPLSTLDETTEALSSAVSGDVSRGLQGHIDTIRQILEGHPDEAAVERLRALFERLADLTWARTDAMVHPPREQREEWIRTASS